MQSSYFSGCILHFLCDAENDKLCRTYRGYADFTDQAAVQDIVLAHRGAADLDVIGQRHSRTHEGPVAALGFQEKHDRAFHAGPQVFVVGFKYGPGGIPADGFFLNP